MDLKKYSIAITFLLAVLLFSCSTNKSLTPNRMTSGESVKLVLQDGQIENAIILKKEGREITYVSESDHKEHTVLVQKIKRVERLDAAYDLTAHPISTAEIEKYKKNWNTFGFAIGGAAIGGVAGLAMGLPLWYAEVDPVPPYFIAGATAVIGSIYFAVKGEHKDQEQAINEIRYVRKNERDLQAKIDLEKAQLKKLEAQKQDLENKLEQKDREKRNGESE